MKLKILTLNLHTLQEKDIEKKNAIIAKFINDKNIDVIFFQEVGQLSSDPIYRGNIKTSNQLLTLFPKLDAKYNFDFEFRKKGFGLYDEGLAIVSKYPIIYSNSYFLSNSKSYENWQTRIALKINIEVSGKQIDLITTHLGWDSESEKYSSQLDNLLSIIDKNHITVCAGDFNVPYNSPYIEQIKKAGFIPSSDIAKINAVDNPTFPGELDSTPYLKVSKDHQIDYVFMNCPYNVLDYQIVFKEDRVSDHYGVYNEIEF
jgi:maltose 6'-phosphate phosphatase